MDRNDLYKATFSQVHTSVKIELEDAQTVNRPHRIKKSLVALVAIVCLILSCSVTAYAMNLLGLKDLVLNKSTSEVTGQAPSIENNDISDTSKPEQMISLQGYPESNEYKACEEWTTFRNSYDQDGALLEQVGNNPTPFDQKYGLYNVYTQEMADKLDEITTKYGLALYSTIEVISSNDELFSKADTGDFLGTQNKNRGAFIYDDSSFHIDGDSVLNNGIEIPYQFMSYKKGTFSDVLLNIGNADHYDEWSYKTASGMTVSLAMGPEKSVVILETGKSFVTINVLAGTETGFSDQTGKITPSDLEAFSNSFDFSVLK